MTKIVIPPTCRIEPSADIGSPGVLAQGGRRRPSSGGVVLREGVDIGANTTIHRGHIGDTTVGAHTFIGALCNIGHDVKIGSGCLIGPLTSFSGHVEVGNGVVIEPGCSIRNKIKIGDNSHIGLGSVVVEDVKPGETVVGVPARPIKFRGNHVHPSFKHGNGLKIGKYNHIHKDVKVGNNVTIRSYVELRSGTVIGDNCYVDSGVKSSGECVIGNNVTIRYDAIIARNVIIEDDVFISPQVMFINIPFKDKERKKTIIKRGVKIGTNATINDGVEICENTVIGAKAFVNRDIVEPGTYIGIPARRL